MMNQSQKDIVDNYLAGRGPAPTVVTTLEELYNRFHEKELTEQMIARLLSCTHTEDVPSRRVRMMASEILKMKQDQVEIMKLLRDPHLDYQQTCEKIEEILTK